MKTKDGLEIEVVSDRIIFRTTRGIGYPTDAVAFALSPEDKVKLARVLLTDRLNAYFEPDKVTIVELFGVLNSELFAERTSNEN